MYAYDEAFFAYTSAQSLDAAKRVAAAVCALLEPRSVLDVGCALGIWLLAWRGLGVADVYGVDGPYIDRARLLIEKDRFRAADLGQPFSLGRRFDLVQSLEVGEHLPRDRVPDYVGNLVGHADLVLFSAAPPGQGGECHINEQPYEFWRAAFRQYGFRVVDCMRPILVFEDWMPPWYRYNMFLYVRETALQGLPPFLRLFLAPDDRRLQDVSPLTYRIRKAAVALLPPPIMDILARAKARGTMSIPGSRRRRDAGDHAR